MKFLFPILFLLSLGLTARAEEASPNRLSDSEKVKWLGENYGPKWIEKNGAKKTAIGKEPSPGAQLPTLWLPMCFFFDPSVSSELANEKIHTMVYAYSGCGIALEPYTFTLRPDYPNDAKALRVAVEKACPFVSTYGARVAVQIEARFPELPKQMCENQEAEGCSTLCSPTSVSFVKPNAGPAIGLHESMHSNCCGPLCVDKGEGTGLQIGAEIELAFLNDSSMTVHATTSKPSLPTLIQPAGCEALKAGASANNFTHWYEPDRKEYYVPEKDPGQQKDLLLGKNLLPAPRVVSYESPPPAERTPASVLSPKTRTPAPTALPEIPVAKKPLPYDEQMAESEVDEPRGRKRGASLRKGNDLSSKKTGVGTVDAYSNGE